MKNIFIEKKFLEYRLNGFLVSFQVWIYETIPAIARKNYCMKHESQRPRMLSWSNNQHVTYVGLRKTIFDLIKLEANQIVPLEAEKGEEYVVGLFVEGLSGDQDDDNFEHPVVGLKRLIDEGKIKFVDRAERSKEKKNKEKINENGVERLPDEIDKMLAGNEEQTKVLSCGEKDVEVPVRKSDKSVEKSDKAVEKSLRAVDVASPCNEGIIDLLEEVELKDDVWEKVVEVKAVIEAETKIEEGNVQIIDIDD
ncbi:Hypothetical predicted protein [Olea europaea subsp. europaea]|uniref:Uncharacterized protein n=1 Tax=Olea europaea subsp. europaea TaxID=158383 RepID=A0A8S0SMM2_OLEEU|nr:Hypothetical predicted protein [Olea europaea subsp. europaea]